MEKRVNQRTETGSNIYHDNSKRIENRPSINLGNKDSSDIVMWGLIIATLFITIWISPGILVASIIDFFKYLTIGQTWGISIIVSLLLFFWLKTKGESWISAMKKHAAISIVSACIILLGFLFLQYPMPVRSLFKMFNYHTDIPVSYKTSPGETKYFASLHKTANVNSNDIVGEWYGTNAKMIFNETGELIFEWKQGNKESVGTWILQDGILITLFGEESESYWITDFNENEFKFKGISSRTEYTAKKKK